MTLSILVTGATGYVGSYVVPRLAAATSHRVELLVGDVTAGDLVLPRADVVIHLAGKLNSFAGAEAEIARVNYEGTVNLARRCDPGVHFIFLSSDQVFRSDPGRVYTGDDAVAPETPYGRSKAQAEEFLLSNLDQVTILRTAILYGYSHPRRRNTVEFIESKLQAGQPLELYWDVFACPTFIGDLAACIERVVEDRVLGIHHTCGAEYLSRCEIGEALCAARGYSPDLIRPVARPDSSNVPRCLHLRPSSSFDDLLSTSLADWLSARNAYDQAAASAV
jgi:dTDP-4-dehydrorhamnose reductase